MVLAEKTILWQDKEKEQNEQVVNDSTLYIKFDTTNKAIYNKVMLILNLYNGNCPVICKCTNSNKPFKVNKTVNPNNLLLNELVGLLGEDSVVLVNNK